MGIKKNLKKQTFTPTTKGKNNTHEVSYKKITCYYEDLPKLKKKNYFTKSKRNVINPNTVLILIPQKQYVNQKKK